MAQHRARKRFGQNFLQDGAAINAILHAVNCKANDHIIEIGPGQGALTDHLIQQSQHIDLVELDRDLAQLLEQRYRDKPNVKLHQADALQVDFATLIDKDQRARIVGNLPYNISTPLIFHLLSFQQSILDMHFMLQLEVVRRMTATPNSKDYGRLSVMTQYFCHAEELFEVPPEAFDPKPKVTSAIIQLTPYKDLPHTAKDLPTFEIVVKTAFSQRRKTLRNTLKPLIDNQQLEAIGIDPSLRAESLAISDFVTISNHLGPVNRP